MICNKKEKANTLDSITVAQHMKETIGSLDKREFISMMSLAIYASYIELNAALKSNPQAVPIK